MNPATTGLFPSNASVFTLTQSDNQAIHGRSHSPSDVALTVVSNYLRQCGLQHPDRLRDESHRLVSIARERLRGNRPAKEADDEWNPAGGYRLTTVALELAVEEQTDPAHVDRSIAVLERPPQAVMPGVSVRSMRFNATPKRIGPLRLQWWLALALIPSRVPRELMNQFRRVRRMH